MPYHENDLETLRSQVAELRQQVQTLTEMAEQSRHRKKLRHGRRMVRYQTKATVMGFPLVSIASGPNPDHDERAGHAKGILAIGDIATGVIAIGGIARGLLAIGGLAFGGVAVGGVALSVVAAVGGISAGCYAIGGVAIGVHVLGGLRISV